MNIYIQHFKAWLRGDVTKITSVFQKALRQLDEQNKYLTMIADNQAQAARQLVKSSERLYSAAAEAEKVRRNLSAIVG